MTVVERELEPPFSRACATLRERGYNVIPADIPGLTIVGKGVFDQRELTMTQVIDMASQSWAEL